jgi:hypothetical protein
MNDGEARDIWIVDYHLQEMPPSAQASSATCPHATAGIMSLSNCRHNVRVPKIGTFE